MPNTTNIYPYFGLIQSQDVAGNRPIVLPAFSKPFTSKLLFQTYKIYQQRSNTHYSLITTCFSYVLLPKFTSITTEYFNRHLLWIIQKSQDLHIRAFIRNFLSISILYFNRTLFINIPSLYHLPSYHSAHSLLLSQHNKFKPPLLQSSYSQLIFIHVIKPTTQTSFLHNSLTEH